MADTATIYRQPGLSGPGNRLCIVTIAELAGVIFSLSVRFWTNSKSRRGISLADWLILAAAVLDALMSGFSIAGVYYGFGNPTPSVHPYNVATAIETFWVTQIIYKLVLCLVKMSFLVMYLQVFYNGQNKFFAAAIYTMMTIVTGYTIASVGATIGQCHPISYAWDKKPGTNQYCINLTAFWLSNGIFSIVTDFGIIVLPCAMCFRLNASHTAKLGLLLIFSVGFFVLGTSIARLTTLDYSSKSVDQMVGAFESTVWTNVEANTAIICANLPAFKRPIKEILGYFLSDLKTSHEIRAHRPEFFPGPRANDSLDMPLGPIHVLTAVAVHSEQWSENSSSLTTLGTKTQCDALEVA